MRATRERALAEQLTGWTYVPLTDPERTEPRVVVAGRPLPQRFGGWWQHHDAYGTDEQRPTGKEVILWLRLDGDRVVQDEVTFRGFDTTEFERFGVPAMRELTELFAALRGSAGDGVATGALVRSATVAERGAILGEQKRRRRRNAVPVELVAELYRAGGIRAIMNGEGVSEATAHRWRNKAVEVGLLDAPGGAS